MSTSDPDADVRDHTRLSAAELQTLRGTLNTVEELTLRQDGPPAGVFDPIRLEQLRGLNEFLERLADDMASTATTEIVFDPTERMVARQALGTVESLLTTDAGQEQLAAVGIRPSRKDISTLSDLISRIEPPLPEDLAGTDVRYQLWTEPFSLLNEGGASIIYHTYSQWRRNVFDAEQRAIDGRESAGRIFNILEQEYKSVFDSDWETNIESFVLLASSLARATHLNDGEREQVKNRVLGHVDDALDEMERHDFATPADRYRLDLAAAKAAYSLDRGRVVDPMLTLVDMVAWTRYRMEVGLTEQ